MSLVTLNQAAPFPERMIATVIDWPRRSGGGLNVEFKSLGYANERYARKRVEAAGCDIAIMLSEQSFVACADTANVFTLSGDRLLTPPTRDRALRGTVREQILEIGPSVGFEKGRGPPYGVSLHGVVKSSRKLAIYCIEHESGCTGHPHR